MDRADNTDNTDNTDNAGARIKRDNIDTDAVRVGLDNIDNGGVRMGLDNIDNGGAGWRCQAGPGQPAGEKWGSALREKAERGEISHIDFSFVAFFLQPAASIFRAFFR